MMCITSYQLYKDLSYFLIIGADIVLFGFCLMVFELVGQHERNTVSLSTVHILSPVKC